MTAESTTLDPAAMATLACTPAVLRSMLEGMPEAAITTPGAEGWSPKDVVAHLLSIHYAANVQRVKWILENENAVVPNVDEDDTLRASGMRDWPLARLLDEYAAARGEAMVWLRELTPEQLARTGQHQVAGPITVADVVHHIAFHDQLHIAQVAQLLSIPLEQRRGAMRMFV
jgi:hypothetical protein